MGKQNNIVRTPHGIKLGERVMVNGELAICCKCGKKEETLTLKQLVECVSCVKVNDIIYENGNPAKPR